MKLDDTSRVLEYIRHIQSKDPYFFYALQIDTNGLIANIFWTDSKTMVVYSYFGDMVSFDTTLGKINKVDLLLCLLGKIIISKQQFLGLHYCIIKQLKPLFGYLIHLLKQCQINSHKLFLSVAKNITSLMYLALVPKCSKTSQWCF